MPEKPLSDYLIPGTNVVNFSRWSRENVPKEPHRIPIGQVVSYKVDEFFGDNCGAEIRLVGRARMIVVAHHFDCDGTALYEISQAAVATPKPFHERQVYRQWYPFTFNGISEESLKPDGPVVTVEPWESFIGAMRSQ